MIIFVPASDNSPRNSQYVSTCQVIKCIHETVSPEKHAIMKYILRRMYQKKVCSIDLSHLTPQRPKQSKCSHSFGWWYLIAGSTTQNYIYGRGNIQTMKTHKESSSGNMPYLSATSTVTSIPHIQTSAAIFILIITADVVAWLFNTSWSYWLLTLSATLAPTSTRLQLKILSGA